MSVGKGNIDTMHSRYAALEAELREAKERVKDMECIEDSQHRAVMQNEDLRAENATLRAIVVSEEDLSVICKAVDTLEMWFDGGYKNASGFSPMWNPTLRRLRNLRDKFIASRAKESK